MTQQMIKPAKAGFFMSSVWDLSTHGVDLLDHQTRESGFFMSGARA
jgi:hypothetical protein